MIEALTESAMAPFLSQVGWQGFAYGLLGLKTIKKTLATVKETYPGVKRREAGDTDGDDGED